jgi:glycosyltransferase involved in cell wall biosynthesis
VPLGRPVERDGVRVWYFPSRRLRRLYWSPAMARALAREIRSFDLVHLHSVFLWPTWAAARAARNAGLPYILSPRGMLVRRLIERKSRRLKSAWISLIERRNLEAAAAVHVTSAVEARELRAFGFRLPEVVTIPNGVDAPEAAPEAAPGALPGEGLAADVAAPVGRDRLVLFLGRLNWKKGLDRLIEAMAEVPGGHLAIVGNDEDGLLPELAGQVQALGIAERVSFVPRGVEGGDKEALFAAASLVVLPSLSENFGNVVLEAMIRGRPVIASPEVGAAGIAAGAGAGLVFDGTPEDLAAKIREVLDQPERARLMGEAGRREAEAHLGWPAMAERMAACYEAILARSPPGGRGCGPVP